MNTVYAFCRRTDDIVDEGNESNGIKYEKLHRWRIELEMALKGKSNSYLLNKLSRIIKQFNIPLDPFFDLIQGMEMDLQKNRYLKIEDLIDYCYRVASTVGLMSIEIFGYKKNSTKEYAVNLGLALQLTNILRDVKKDAEQNRIYLPQEDIKRFGYSNEQIFQNKYNNEFKSLMSFEADRAEKYFNKANSALDFEDKPSLFAARAMQHIYYKLLQKLKQNNYDVFNQNVKVSKFEKTFFAAGVWAKYSLIY